MDVATTGARVLRTKTTRRPLGSVARNTPASPDGKASAFAKGIQTLKLTIAITAEANATINSQRRYAKGLYEWRAIINSQLFGHRCFAIQRSALVTPRIKQWFGRRRSHGHHQ